MLFALIWMMHSTLIVITGAPLPGRWALARAVARRLAARLFYGAVDGPADGECLIVHGDLLTPTMRADVLSLPADERVLVEWMCSQAEAHREIFHRWVRRPVELAERELDRYASWMARVVPVEDCEAETVVRVGAQAPLGDQVLRVLSALRPRPDRPNRPETRATSVLVVEDDPDQRLMVGEVLSELGCQVELAPDAGVALALLESEPFDLVLSDERMPGLSGSELAAEVAQRYPATRVVLLTAFADGPTVERALGARAGNVLAKPVSVVDLQRVLDDLT
jgi:CheY-like chemotaxis protein